MRIFPNYFEGEIVRFKKSLDLIKKSEFPSLERFTIRCNELLIDYRHKFDEIRFKAQNDEVFTEEEKLDLLLFSNKKLSECQIYLEKHIQK